VNTEHHAKAGAAELDALDILVELKSAKPHRRSLLRASTRSPMIGRQTLSPLGSAPCTAPLLSGTALRVPYQTGGILLKTCKKRNETHLSLKRTRRTRPTQRWPPRPTGAAQSKAPSSRFCLARGFAPPSSGFPPRSRVRTPLERVPPRSRDPAPLERVPPRSRVHLRLARGSLTRAPVPARGYEHLMF
jgi:hypothetical protein